MSSLTASATGTLGTTPLGELLIFLLDRALTGTVVIEDQAGGRSALAVRSGEVVKVRLGSEAHRIGEVCVELGLVDREDVDSVLETKSANLFGAQLCGLGLLEAEELEEALVKQRFRQIEWLAKLPDPTVYGFYDGANFLADWGGPAREVDPLALIWSSVSVRHNMERARRVAERLGQRELRLHPQSRVHRFRFNQEEQVLLDVLRAKPHTRKELHATGLLKADHIDLMLTALTLTRHIDLGEDNYPLAVDLSASRLPPARDFKELGRRRRSVATTQPIDLPPSNPTPELERRRAEIEEMAERAPSMNYYELLGIPEDAESGAIQSAFLQLAKSWHPDKLPSTLRGFRDVVTKVFSRMTEAHQVLTNSTQRAEYDRLMSEGSDSPEEQEHVQQLLRAASSFQKAEVLAKRGSWEQAITLASKAFEDDPEQPEYGALYAYCVAKSGQRREGAEYDDLITILNKAVKQQKENVRIRLYRAHVFKIAGNTQGAIRDFRAVAEADPNNVDAARELRLFKMRNESSLTGQEAGFWGKLFKK